MCGEGGAWQGYVWQVGHAWLGGGHAWQEGVCGRAVLCVAGGEWQRVCVAGGQAWGGAHPTGMHSCYIVPFQYFSSESELHNVHLLWTFKNLAQDIYTKTVS